MESGNLAQWLLKEGDEFEEGDGLAEVETDKATVTWELVGEEGFIAKFLVEEGQKNIKVGDIVAVYVDDESKLAAFKNVSVADILADSGVAAPASAPAAAVPTPAANPAPS